jgi:hypothetical protein
MFQYLKQVNEFDKIHYQRNTNGVHLNLIVFNVSQLVIAIWRTREFVTCSDTNSF